MEYWYQHTSYWGYAATDTYTMYVCTRWRMLCNSILVVLVVGLLIHHTTCGDMVYWYLHTTCTDTSHTTSGVLVCSDVWYGVTDTPHHALRIWCTDTTHHILLVVCWHSILVLQVVGLLIHTTCMDTPHHTSGVTDTPRVGVLIHTPRVGVTDTHTMCWYGVTDTTH